MHFRGQYGEGCSHKRKQEATFCTQDLCLFHIHVQLHHFLWNVELNFPRYIGIALYSKHGIIVTFYWTVR